METEGRQGTHSLLAESQVEGGEAVFELDQLSLVLNSIHLFIQLRLSNFLYIFSTQLEFQREDTKSCHHRTHKL